LLKIRAVTTADVQAVARDIFRDERLNLVAVGPGISDGQFSKDFSFPRP
jgi:predicted Zn-dependent peptidase